MKYDKELYINSGFYYGDFGDDIENHKEKIVKCRKPHNVHPVRKKSESENMLFTKVDLWMDSQYQFIHVQNALKNGLKSQDKKNPRNLLIS